MKHAYIERNFRAKSLATIALANQIIDTYAAQGYSLTLRQLYYRLVAGGHIDNKYREYKNLGNVINDARLAGLIDWYAIEDRTRWLQDKTRWDNPTHIMKATRDSFIIDRWKDQPYRVEVWVEKDALIGVIGRAARELDIPYFSCRGYTSQSEMWRASMRVLKWLKGGQEVLIIHLADHDPSGIDMTRDIIDRMDVFWAGQVDVNRIALNMDQVQHYNPPPFWAKAADSRHGAYVVKFGPESWELDALEPAVLHDLIKDTVLPLRDEATWAETLEEEEDMRDLLNDALEWVKPRDIWRTP